MCHSIHQILHILFPDKVFLPSTWLIPFYIKHKIRRYGRYIFYDHRGSSFECLLSMVTTVHQLDKACTKSQQINIWAPLNFIAMPLLPSSISTIDGTPSGYIYAPHEYHEARFGNCVAVYRVCFHLWKINKASTPTIKSFNPPIIYSFDAENNKT